MGWLFGGYSVCVDCANSSLNKQTLEISVDILLEIASSLWDTPRLQQLEWTYNVQCKNWAQMNEHWNRELIE